MKKTIQLLGTMTEAPSAEHVARMQQLFEKSPAPGVFLLGNPLGFQGKMGGF